MKILFPKQLDNFGLEIPLAEKNAAESNMVFTLADLPYVLAQLQAKVGVDNSDDVASLDFIARHSSNAQGTWVKEIPFGAVNGTNRTYTLTNAPLSGRLMLFKNGLLQQDGVGNDYTLSGSTITMSEAPLSGPDGADELIAFYLK